ncbi:MAG: glycosyltransferase family 4 protein [Gammaproteobacteria bacterium]|nr:glycosyltransferase family 4 protein [Gammaproteobacteria bacterium]
MLSKGFGGAERLFVDLALALAERDVSVQAVCHKDFVKRAALRHPNISLAPVNVRGAWDLLATHHITAAIRDFGPAVIHSHLARGAHFAGRAARALGIPLAVNLHNYIDLKYYRNASLFVPGTEDQKNYLLQHGIAPQRVEVIPHFSLLPPVDRPRIGGDASAVFVSYGRMVKKKGFDVLLRAFRAVLDQGVQAKLTIGGDGPERSALLQLAEELNLGGVVTFSGWIDDVAAFLDNGDAFVLPSLDEPFGIVVLEAMARGKAIISTKTQGPVEVLDETTAYFAEIGDAASLAQAMLAALRDPGERMSKATAALACFRDHYAEDVVVPRFIDLYRRLAGGIG